MLHVVGAYVGVLLIFCPFPPGRFLFLFAVIADRIHLQILRPPMFLSELAEQRCFFRRWVTKKKHRWVWRFFDPTLFIGCRKYQQQQKRPLLVGGIKKTGLLKIDNIYTRKSKCPKNVFSILQQRVAIVFSLFN